MQIGEHKLSTANLNKIHNTFHVKQRALYADTVSFTSIAKPTVREKKEVASIEQFINEKLIQPIKSKIKDASTLIRLKAYEGVKFLDGLKYNPSEKEALSKAERLTIKDINTYSIPEFIKELKTKNFEFYFADDILPEDLWEDEDFLESWNMDEDDIEYQLTEVRPLSVKDVLKKQGSAEIHYNRKGCKAMFLFNEKNPSPDSFWHEWFHYKQKQAGLMRKNINTDESRGSAFAKRELETYQFIINNRDLLKLSTNAIKKNIAIWNSYKDLYNYEKEYTRKQAIPKYIDASFSLEHLIKPLQLDIEEREYMMIDLDAPLTENSMLKALITKHGLDIEQFN